MKTKLILKLKYWGYYKYWKMKKKGKKFNDFERGVGYYLPVGLITAKIIGTVWESEMKSGKTGIYECISYRTCKDPHDMIKTSQWDMIGYKGDVTIKDSTFREFLMIYCGKKLS
jgi:hypothetical protein